MGDDHYAGRDQILQGFKQHFEALAKQKDNEKFDQHYHELIINEVKCIENLVAGKKIGHVSIDELRIAVQCINLGKSHDFYGLTIENIIHAGECLESFLLDIINCISDNGVTPNSLKVGLLTPIFKNNGEKTISSNYEGIWKNY